MSDAVGGGDKRARSKRACAEAVSDVEISLVVAVAAAGAGRRCWAYSLTTVLLCFISVCNEYTQPYRLACPTFSKACSHLRCGTDYEHQRARHRQRSASYCLPALVKASTGVMTSITCGRSRIGSSAALYSLKKLIPI